MFAILRHPVFRRLFTAQAVALVGTGLLTVALGLLAYDLAGDAAGRVLGTALAIKMIAYVCLSPLAQAVLSRFDRRKVLIGADIVRAAAALFLPFISEIWQIYVTIFVLQAASAAFTPTFQAAIPDILPEEGDYTRALSLSRLAYDIENLVSPALAGLALLFLSYDALFAGTALGFAVSALLVRASRLPPGAAPADRPFRDRLTRGARIYFATPRLRGLWVLNLAAASIGAFVIVNTVVVVRDLFGGAEAEVALAFAAYGAGSMVAALVLPRLLDRVPDRPVMLAAAVLITVLAAGIALRGPALGWGGLLWGWGGLGLAYSAILTPSGRLLRRSAHPEDRPAIFTAQFALSHAGWLLTYPLAGWLGPVIGLWPALGVMAAVAAAGSGAALLLWPRQAAVLEHDHPELPPDHPHLAGADNKRHAHRFVIDDEHRAWPSQG